MGAASQAVIDAAAQAIAQETLDRRHTWRQLCASKHGLPDVERNVIKIHEPPIQPFYDQIIEQPIKVTESVSLNDLQQLIKSQESRVEAPRVQEPRVQEPRVQEPRVEAPQTSTLKKTLIGLGTAGAIGASGLAGYFFNKPKEPETTTQTADGDLLQELRKRGYHLRRTE